MTQQLEKTWAGKALNQEELKQYVNFEQNIKTKFTEKEIKIFEKNWDNLINEVQNNLNKDPNGEIGIALGKRFMEWVNSLYGKEYAALRTTIWEKGFQGGHIGAEHNLSPEAIDWLDIAMSAYYKNRIYNVLNQVETHSHEIVLKQWEELLIDMYGVNQVPTTLLDAIMNDNKITLAAKNWVKKR